jgi:hypothetical protein
MAYLPDHRAGPRLEIEDATGFPLDTIKALFTYLIVLIVVVGGCLMLYSMRLDPPESGSGTLSLAIVGFVSGALTFLFGQEVQTRTARQAAASTAASTAATTAATAAANSGVGAVSQAADTGGSRTP